MLKRIEIDPCLKILKPEDSMHMPIIIRVIKFDEDACKVFSDEMSKAQTLPQPVIPIVIDSFGGGSNALMTMVSEISHSSKPVATIVEGKAYSCGTILFGFGTPGYRFIGPHAWLMMHQVSWGTFGKESDIKADAEHLTVHNREIYEMLAMHCGKKKDYFINLMKQNNNADLYINPRNAKKYGLADHIRVPELTVRIKVQTEFK